jgi:hypothetical protein
MTAARTYRIYDVNQEFTGLEYDNDADAEARSST